MKLRETAAPGWCSKTSLLLRRAGSFYPSLCRTKAMGPFQLLLFWKYFMQFQLCFKLIFLYFLLFLSDRSYVGFILKRFKPLPPSLPSVLPMSLWALGSLKFCVSTMDSGPGPRTQALWGPHHQRRISCHWLPGVGTAQGCLSSFCHSTTEFKMAWVRGCSKVLLPQPVGELLRERGSTSHPSTPSTQSSMEAVCSLWARFYSQDKHNHRQASAALAPRSQPCPMPLRR